MKIVTENKSEYCEDTQRAKWRKTLTRLSVNVNKIATLRNARGGDRPNVQKTALDIESFGAEGITVHPRPDERHIHRKDVYDIAKSIKVEFNIEGYPAPELIALIGDVRPAQATLVPDPPDAITSNAGWKVKQNMGFLQDVIGQIKSFGARVSLFIDPHEYTDSDLDEIVQTGTDRIELYTEAYAKAYFSPERDAELAIYKDVALRAYEKDLQINAGHDLNLDNLEYFISEIPVVEEVSIGHALITDALYFGLKNTVKKYLACLGKS